ncbi:MAG: hypothetical protein EPO36_01745 [Chloroflexota bacterium]|nr:MAG: hypothetical protein EPO36_01745 [Chloroflexota bacterium]
MGEGDPRGRRGSPRDHRRPGRDLAQGLDPAAAGDPRAQPRGWRRAAPSLGLGNRRVRPGAAGDPGRPARCRTAGRERFVSEAPRPAAIAGVRFGLVVSHADLRGSFSELWRAEAFDDLPAAAGHLDPTGQGPLSFVQANLSTSAPGVLRGLHLHRRQLDHWVVKAGRAFVALVDVRPLLDGSAPRPIVETRVLDAGGTVTIPAGVAHGFLAMEPLELVYFVTNAYDGSDELGFAWDDPVAAVPWPAVDGSPDGRPLTSARDAANPSLADLVGRLRG